MAMAKKYGTRLHPLNISTARNLMLFDNTIPWEQRDITSEACTHQLWFSEEDYKTKKSLIE
jgi:dihydroorotase